MTRLMLVDGDNILVRAERATEHVPLHADGVPTAALLVFINSLTRHVREERPDSLVVCWDGGRSAFRTELYPKYKANRPPRTEHEETRRPHGLARSWLSISNVPHVRRPGWEADDLVAAYCRLAAGQDLDVVIVSSDKDLLQLVDTRVVQVKVATGSNPFDCWDVGRVRAHYGVPHPRHLGEVMSLAGDPGDGVPGLPGIGPKRAAKMMEQHSWSWPSVAAELAGDADRWALAAVAYDLIELRHNRYPEMGLTLGLPGRLRPTRPGDALYPDLLDFLDRYALRTVRDRLEADEIWPRTALA